MVKVIEFHRMIIHEVLLNDGLFVKALHLDQ